MMSKKELYMGHAEYALQHMREMEKPNAAEVKFETVLGNPLISDYGEKIDEYIKNAGIDEIADYVKNHIIYPPTHSEENLPGNANRIDQIGRAHV